MNWASFAIGIFLGAPIGFMSAALLCAASRADEEMARYGKDTD